MFDEWCVYHVVCVMIVGVLSTEHIGKQVVCLKLLKVFTVCKNWNKEEK